MVIDSHGLFWWLEGDRKLPDRVRRRIEEALTGKGGGLLVASVTFWEMRLKERRGRIEPKTPVESWPRVLGAIAPIQIIDTSPTIWIRSANLRWDHKDPADRIIADTALVHGVPVLTKDRAFHEADSPVEAVW